MGKTVISLLPRPVYAATARVTARRTEASAAPSHTTAAPSSEHSTRTRPAPSTSASTLSRRLSASLAEPSSAPSEPEGISSSSAEAAARFDLSEPGNVYSRMDNPTTSVFEQRMAALEGGVAAVAFASGTAAIAGAVQNILTKGSHIVAASTLYGGTFNLFAHTLADCGIDATFVQGGDPADFEAAMRPETRLVYIESMGNPNCNVMDIEAIAAVAHAHRVPLMVDNTFGTPYLIRPIEHGADIVVHSTTKFIGGHGSVLGGMVIDVL